MKYPLVSVVVTTKNEERHIRDCLESIKRQTYPNIEIIVVDNNSGDKTKEIAKQYTLKVYSLSKHTNLPNIKNYRGAQLNLGVSKSNGSIIFFPDADMTFDSGLIEEIVHKLEHYDALYIPEKIIGNGFFGQIRDFERSFYNGTPIDAVRAVKKRLFLLVGGFDEINIMFGPDDWDFTKRVNLKTSKVSITTSRIYHHENSLDLKKYLSKKKNYGSTFGGYVLKWGKDDPDIKKQFGASYRLFGVFIEKGKWKKLISHPILTLGMYYLKIRVGLGYLRARK